MQSQEEFNIDNVVLGFLNENPFYAELSRHIDKIATKNYPTAAMCWEPSDDSLRIFYNPEWMSTLTTKQARNILKHEMNHLVFQHLFARYLQPQRIANYAFDLAINSLIYHEDNKSYVSEQDLPLPDGLLVPGRPLLLNQSKKSIISDPIAKLIQNMQPMLSSEEYFQQLMKEVQELLNNAPKCPTCGGKGKIQVNQDNQDNQGDKNGHQCGDHCKGGCNANGDQVCPDCMGSGYNDGITTIDDHSLWQGMGDDVKEYVNARIKQIVDKAVKVADQRVNGWGNIPVEVAKLIRNSISAQVSWKQVLRQFIGTMIPQGRSSSIKKINRRYPYIQPGVKRDRMPKLLIAIDQSGSVDDEMLTLFFAELTHLSKMCTIDVVHFDTYVSEKDVYTWKKGTTPKLQRTRSGGTDFNVIAQFVNSPKNRGRWEGLLMITDGECSKPENVNIKRGWVLPPGHKLNFDSGELQIFIDKNTEMKGVVR